MKSVMKHSFAQLPQANIGRSQFDLSHGHKTTIDADYIYPMTWIEVYPGDTLKVNHEFFARMTTPIYPLMDNLFLDVFWFYQPYRTLWTNFAKMMGEQDDPGDSIDYTMPILTIPAGGWADNTLQDYMGLPPGVQFGTELPISAMTFRMYNQTWNDWFRDENLQDSIVENKGDGPDADTYVLQKRGKRHDYFTSCLPWPQKSDTQVTLPLGTSADIHTAANAATAIGIYSDGAGAFRELDSDGAHVDVSAASGSPETNKMYADLSTATAATINAIRLAVTTQQFLERDARGGTRLPELTLAHFNVTVPDYRTQRPEYLGGSSTPVMVNAVPQTSETGTTAQGNMAAFATANVREGGFTKSFTEWGLVMCLINVRADLTYQQGVNRNFLTQTRYDFFWPEFQHIGEQVVYDGEIYAQGTTADDDVFGYQERYAHHKFMPSRISGKFRSGATGTLHAWHLSENLSAPALDSTFIPSNTPMSRVLAVASQPDFIVDGYFNINAVRPMALYGTPGLARF